MKSRYVPFTQQPYCCTPTCIQMVMYKHSIPLRSQEDIGYEIGLIVPEEDAYLFQKVRTGEKPSAGWGTQISDPKYNLNDALNRLSVPLKVEFRFISSISSSEKLEELLETIQKADEDALLCFNYGELWNKDTTSGHVCVFNSLENDGVWLIDPESKVPKLRKTSLTKLYEAMKSHGDSKSGGVWILRSK